MARYIIDNRQKAIDFELDNYTTARLLQNAKNLLMCRQGEVPYDRYRGFHYRLLDMPIEDLNEVLVEEMDRIMQWEPDVEVVSAEAKLDENHETIITVVIEINNEEG